MRLDPYPPYDPRLAAGTNGRADVELGGQHGEGSVVGLEHELGVVVDPLDAIGPVVTAGGALMRTGGFGDPVTSPGQYLENGARFYLDCGDHPEYATPECRTAQELLEADCAGLALMSAMAERAEGELSARAGRPVRVRVLRNNVAPNATTWGTHENYLVPAQLTWAEIAFPLASHLASRVCFAGAGTVIPAVPHQRSARFRLSQRAPFVGGVVASSTLTVPVGKPMVMARDEPLADPRRYRRLQVVCGDATLAHTATLLKVGTTMIALRLIREGATPGLSLDEPVAALQLYSADPSLRSVAPTSEGRLRATDLQRRWLECAVRFHERVGLPDDEADILEPWDDVLTALEDDPATAADRVDWIAKLAVLERLRAREGVGWGDVRVTAADLSYHDVRFDRGVYGRLAASGRMRLLANDEAVDRLRTTPPESTRARTRGTLIRLLRQCGYHYEVNWTTCQYTAGSERVEVQLDDPFSTSTALADEVIAQLEADAADHTRRGIPLPRATRQGIAQNDAEFDYLGWWASVAG
jgi:proteasome accessory factor A